MSICLGSRFTAQQPLVEYLNKIAPHFRALELSAEPKHLSPYFTYSVSQKKALRIYKKHYQFHLSMHAPFIDCRLGALDPEERQLSRIRILAAMQLAADLEVKHLTFHPCTLETGAPERYMENCCHEEDNLAYLLKKAQSLGVNLLMENMPQLPIFHSSTCDGSRLQELLWLFPETQFGLTLDLSHALQAKIKIESLLKLERVRHFHLHENDREANFHLPITGNLIWWHKLLNQLNKEFSGKVGILEMDRIADQLTSSRNLQTPPRQKRPTPFSNPNLTPPG
jgi:sugar phosphate isomerase/epimerase